MQIYKVPHSRCTLATDHVAGGGQGRHCGESCSATNKSGLVVRSGGLTGPRPVRTKTSRFDPLHVKPVMLHKLLRIWHPIPRRCSWLGRPPAC